MSRSRSSAFVPDASPSRRVTVRAQLGDGGT
jgi:hypothetical protein